MYFFLVYHHYQELKWKLRFAIVRHFCSKSNALSIALCHAFIFCFYSLTTSENVLLLMIVCPNAHYNIKFETSVVRQNKQMHGWIYLTHYWSNECYVIIIHLINIIENCNLHYFYLQVKIFKNGFWRPWSGNNYVLLLTF